MAKRKSKYHLYSDYPIVIKHKDFMFQWCCDCGLRHIHFVEIERGDKPENDRVNLYLIRDDHATNYRKDYERLKKKEVETMALHKHTKTQRRKIRRHKAKRWKK